MYYYKSEKQATFWALKALDERLPATPKSAVEHPEWGLLSSRWEPNKDHSVARRHIHSPENLPQLPGVCIPEYQPVVPAAARQKPAISRKR